MLLVRSPRHSAGLQLSPQRLPLPAHLTELRSDQQQCSAFIGALAKSSTLSNTPKRSSLFSYEVQLTFLCIAIQGYVLKQTMNRPLFKYINNIGWWHFKTLQNKQGDDRDSSRKKSSSWQFIFFSLWTSKKVFWNSPSKHFREKLKKNTYKFVFCFPFLKPPKKCTSVVFRRQCRCLYFSTEKNSY